MHQISPETAVRDNDLAGIEDAARRRLHPSIADPNWLVLRIRRRLFQRWLRDVDRQAMWVLDVGGRIQPYRVLLGEKCRRYVAIDLVATPVVNIVGSAEDLPLVSDCFDLVLCTQLLEYIADPVRCINEIYRVLKPGGFLLLSVPAVFPRDSEYDRWRFLPPALRTLLHRFSRVDVAPEGNSIVGLIRTINVCFVMFSKPRAVSKALQLTVIPCLNVLGALVEKLSSSTNDQFSANFSVLAQK